MLTSKPPTSKIYAHRTEWLIGGFSTLQGRFPRMAEHGNTQKQPTTCNMRIQPRKTGIHDIHGNYPTDGNDGNDGNPDKRGRMNGWTMLECSEPNSDSENGTTIHQKSHGSEPYFSNTNPNKMILTGHHMISMISVSSRLVDGVSLHFGINESLVFGHRVRSRSWNPPGNGWSLKPSAPWPCVGP